jgi:PAS domain S-box-containing protein
MNTKIFAVDDEVEILNSYKNLLGVSKQEGLDFFSSLESDAQKEEFMLETFTTGEAYLERLQALYKEGEKLPLVLLDMRLPGKHGFEIAKETRAIDKEIIIIILSAYADHSAKELADELDHNIYYLHKPFREDELYLLITSTLKQWNNKSNVQNIKKELAIDSIEDGLWDWDMLTNEIYFSPRWKSMIGYEDDELANAYSEWASRIHPDDFERTMKDVADHFEKKNDYYINEHRLKCKDGSYKWILGRGKVIFDSQNKPSRMSGFHTDITQRKLLEQELLGVSKQLSDELEVSISKESKLKHTNLELEQKLAQEIALRRQKEEMLLQHTRHAAMGEMINMIAHQWRQPLTSIGLSADNILISVALDSLAENELQENLELINRQVHYLSQTIDDFRNFFLPNKAKEQLLAQQCIENALLIVEKILLSKKITLEKSYEDTTAIFLYKSELVQVILNLIKNAQDCFDERKIEKPFVLLQTQEDATKIYIRVCDNGGGINAEVQKRIFEPYFTTKSEHNGTGLGLYMSKMIVEEHMQGSIYATNTQEGVCFTIEIPKS